MANLKDIQRKIKSVSGTQKTTRAMKLVSTAKLRRAEELAKKSSLYATKLNEVLGKIAGSLESASEDSVESLYFKQADEVKNVAVVFVTADKGLCGAFNHATIKTVSKLIRDYESKGAKVTLHGVGKKGVEFFKYNKREMENTSTSLSSAPDYEKSTNFISPVVDSFVNGEVDKVYLIHNGYKNMITQEMKINQLLPVDVQKIEKSKDDSTLEIEAYNEELVLEALLKKYVEYNMYYSLIDSLAAEHSARMQAMDAATNNAKEMVKNLKVQFNKARQEAITTELIEIISGVESMK
ncbi:ATP synthase, F1 gamma subunit [Thiovulum sp. ES]|nr:ATP synthase, F1 gamma subunit [Thiovulum sp. ES]